MGELPERLIKEIDKVGKRHLACVGPGHRSSQIKSFADLSGSFCSNRLNLTVVQTSFPSRLLRLKCVFCMMLEEAANYLGKQRFSAIDSFRKLHCSQSCAALHTISAAFYGILQCSDPL
jgi:hypothetical protein